MKTTKYDSRLRRPISRGHIAGICQSLGFDYNEVSRIEITPDSIVIDHVCMDFGSGKAGAIVTTELPIERVQL